MIVTSYGDSHSFYAWKNIRIPGVTIRRHHVGSRLMNTFTRHGKLWRLPQDTDVIVYCFGEIDVRVHTHQHGIGDLPFRYAKTILQLETTARPIVMGIVPPLVEPPSVHNGTPDERLEYTLDMNEALCHACEYLEVDFLPVYELYAGDDGFFEPTLLGKRGHIGDHRPLEKLLMEVL